MLHKKSEYRLQYSKLNKEVRRKIWQDNILARKSRLLSNQATHYWEYQLRDEVCDCDNGDEEEEEEEEGPLPPHRKKHNSLKEKYSQQCEKAQMLPLNLMQRDAREIAVQTPEWNGDEPNNRVGDTSDDELTKQINSITLEKAGDNHSRPASSALSKLPLTTLSCPKTATSLIRPTLTSRKLHSETRRTHFVPYGWNEAKTDLGHKQTYNICAPQKEVHESALTASHRRNAEIDMFLAQEKQQIKHHARSKERTSSNSSSLWMSEYQEQFAGKVSKNSSRNSRPLSAPPASRQSVSWRHS